jgi:hybrid polyketide synthase/nonribosomal peptide synthetase ACE1
MTTNSHTTGLETSFTPLVVSAASERSLRELLSAYRSYLLSHPAVSLADFAYTLQERRSTLAYRVAFAASSVEDAAGKMAAMLEKESGSGTGGVPEFCERHFHIARPRILGVFTGQGAQWPRMGARLIEMSPLLAS